MMKTWEMRREVRRPVSRAMASLHQLVGVQAALHHGLRIAGAAHGHAQLRRLGFAVRLENGIGRDIQLCLCRQGLHLRLIADQGGLDEPFDRCFDGAAQGYVRERPDHGGGDGRQVLAAIDELVKNVVIGRMANQRVNGNIFCQRCEVAHSVLLPAPLSGDFGSVAPGAYETILACVC